MQCCALKLSFVQFIETVFPKGVVNYFGSIDLLDPQHYHQHTIQTPTPHSVPFQIDSITRQLSIWCSCSSCVSCVCLLTCGLG